MIESGSHVVGVDATSLGLPEGTALRMERPAAALWPFFSTYSVYDSDPVTWAGAKTWSMPAWAQLWIVLTENAITVQVRNRHYASLGTAVLYGPTSRVMPVISRGGVSVCLHIRPLGWARWFGGEAEGYRDRITPFDQVWPEARVADLVTRVHASDRGPRIKPLLDDFLLDCLPQPNPNEDRIARVLACLADPAFNEAQAVAEAVGVTEQTLLRLCNRFFGFGPKLMLRRARFLRALTTWMLADAPPSPAALPNGYHDASHFIRDGHDFLGMTPRQFLAMDKRYLLATMRARRQVTGAPTPALDPFPPVAV